ncbi:hypothetical protein GDO81_020906 [Engystomops pustulosus]|uniref:Uncharacterized protein n=1 Tax=Engystomops pustulosus TaxID=76066 RepID=A0AAV6YQ99_ENGPU|nr:hypothetical protein GDO81_020906 [Engystomops pustulosus]
MFRLGQRSLLFYGIRAQVGHALEWLYGTGQFITRLLMGSMNHDIFSISYHHSHWICEEPLHCFLHLLHLTPKSCTNIDCPYARCVTYLTVKTRWMFRLKTNSVYWRMSQHCTCYSRGTRNFRIFTKPTSSYSSCQIYMHHTLCTYTSSLVMY